MCAGGIIPIDRCPREIMGAELMEAVNLASMCGKGDWPVAGGLMDQSAWFVDLKQKLQNELNKIERDDLKNGRA